MAEPIQIVSVDTSTEMSGSEAPESTLGLLGPEAEPLKPNFGADGPKEVACYGVGYIRSQKALDILQRAGTCGVSGRELKEALYEPGIASVAMNGVVFHTLKRLERELGEGSILHSGETQNRRHTLVAAVVVRHVFAVEAPTVSVETTSDQMPRTKLTRWGLEQREDNFFIRGRSLGLNALATQCLKLLVENPYGISRRRLRAALRLQNDAAGTDHQLTDFDIYRALGDVREATGETERDERIHEELIFNGRNRVELLTLVGRYAKKAKG